MTWRIAGQSWQSKILYFPKQHKSRMMLRTVQKSTVSTSSRKCHYRTVKWARKTLIYVVKIFNWFSFVIKKLSLLTLTLTTLVNLDRRVISMLKQIDRGLHPTSQYRPPHYSSRNKTLNYPNCFVLEQPFLCYIYWNSLVPPSPPHYRRDPTANYLILYSSVKWTVCRVKPSIPQYDFVLLRSQRSLQK